MTRDDLRNVAIIAHVDHGKTTLLDGILRQTGSIETRKATGDRMMDSNDQEKERGITILAKNTGVSYGDHFINIVDTPGHADLGGQVERILNMVDGALLLVDAFDGPMPQTRFVLNKALELGLHLIVLINKIERPGARTEQVLNDVYDLFIELGANDKQVDFPVLYTSAKEGYALTKPGDSPKDLSPLMDCIIAKVPPPSAAEGSFQFLVSAVDYDPYLGRVLIGKVSRGKVSIGDQVAHINADGEVRTSKISALFGFKGLGREPRESANSGDLVAIAGIPDATVGETLADPRDPEALPGITVTQPTLTMTFRVNDSPFAGTEGKYVTSRHLRDRLYRETLADVSLRVEDGNTPDEFRVSGRGQLHLGIVIETMRREGYEFAVSRPEVIMKEEGGQKLEPVEELILDVPELYMGSVMENLGGRKGDMEEMVPLGSGRTRLRFSVPTRTLMGFRSEFLTQTRGEGIMTHAFSAYRPYKGALRNRNQGVLVSMGQGDAVAFAIWQLQDRGKFIIGTGTLCYEGMIVGLHNRPTDLVVNVQKKKQHSNVRSANRDDNILLAPPVQVPLEAALELIEDDELVEVTPESIRMRKRILNESSRRTWEKKNKAG